MMSSLSVISSVIVSILISSCFCCLIHAQQPYVGRTTTACGKTDNSALGYSCNGLNRTCQAYLIFRSQPPHTTVASISSLLRSDPSQLAQINSVSESQTFETNKPVIAPVTCSCSGDYYQSNTSYVVQSGDNYLIIANNTYQGLSTCQALQDQNRNRTTTLIYAGEKLTVPLRCACPTKNQSDAGIRYLLSYIVDWKDTVSAISVRFDADIGRTLEANELSEQNSVIHPFTTLLIPMQNPPSSSQTVVPPSPPSLPPPPSPSYTSNNSSKKTWVYVLAGVLGGVALILIFGVIIFIVFFRKSKKRGDPIIVSESSKAYEKPIDKKLDEESGKILESISSMAESIKVYKIEELKAATDNFSPSCWLNGSVYRGFINGDFAAIKRMNGDVSKEINLLNKICHSNLIRLLGICFNDGSWYLVYEFAANGSLSEWIYYTNNGGKFLNWSQRVQIALDVATGLYYLHSFTNHPHVHKDVKSSNILLDSHLRAKIANFALARSTEGLEGEIALTRHIVGTRGYMAPEYLENGLISTKLDVYAFGVLTLEIITGREAAALYSDENMNILNLLNNVLSEENGQGSLMQLLDPSLQGNYPTQLAIYMVRLIDSCLIKNPANRLAMYEVVQSLSRILTASLAWELSNNISGYQCFRSS